MVFPYSGLPANTSKFKLAISSIIGNKKAWHELDIHGAYHLIIDEETMKAVGILLNQHNYHHSFVLGKDFILPDNGKIKLAISKYSNEPYLWKEKAETIRTSGSPFKGINYIYHKTNYGGLNSGLDYLGNKKEMEEINPILVTLKPNNPLYTSHMLLGDKKKIFGFIPSWYLVGPPGMDFYSHPAMKNLSDLFCFWHINPHDDIFLKKISKFNNDFKKINFGTLIGDQNKKW